MLLDEEAVEIIREVAIGIGQRYTIEMETIGVDKDHNIYFAVRIRRCRRER